MGVAFVGGASVWAGGARGAATSCRVCTRRRAVVMSDVKKSDEETTGGVAGRAKLVAATGGIVALGGAMVYGLTSGGVSVDRLVEFGDWVLSMGVGGQFIYGIIYTLLEIVAVPALPLTVGCGYLFGPVKGTAIVSAASTAAAALSFLISRYALRDYIGRFASNNPRFRAVDRAVSKEGFKFTLLLRLSPIFPFALSNYFYGLTSLKFWPYLLGSWLGMLPGTIAYVSGGAAAEELTSVASGKGHSNVPLMAVGAVATVVVLFSLSRVASSSLEEEDVSVQNAQE